MSVPVNVTARRAGLGPRAVAAENWGELPDWMAALVAEIERTSGVKAAARIGYSASVVSSVLRRSYGGDVGKVEEAIRGALMGETVECPVLGDIPLNRCLREQSMPFAATSPFRTRLYRACRSGCPHSRLPEADDAAL